MESLIKSGRKNIPDSAFSYFWIFIPDSQ